MTLGSNHRASCGMSVKTAATLLCLSIAHLSCMDQLTLSSSAPPMEEPSPELYSLELSSQAKSDSVKDEDPWELEEEEEAEAKEGKRVINARKPSNARRRPTGMPASPAPGRSSAPPLPLSTPSPRDAASAKQGFDSGTLTSMLSVTQDQDDDGGLIRQLEGSMIGHAQLNTALAKPRKGAVAESSTRSRSDEMAKRAQRITLRSNG